MITKNCKLSEFAQKTKDKKVICFGAGATGQIFASRLDSAVLERIQYFLDNDKGKWNQSIKVKDKVYEIRSPEILDQIDIEGGGIIILVTNRFWDQVHAQLEAMPKLRDVECYVYLLMKANGCREDYVIPEGPLLIPKKIHYCWFGDNEMSKNEIKCIESWKRFCPDYEIIRWDEDNYDCRKTKCLREAYDYGHFSGVSDYVRLDVVNKFGGIYFDTDVELVRNIDELLRLPAFMGFDAAGTINTGHGFGAVQDNHIYNEIIDRFDSLSFYNDEGEFDFIVCLTIINKILEEHGLIPDGKIQQVEDITIFPNEYFDPVMQIPVENTYSIHRYSSSWSFKGMDMTKIWEQQREYWEQLKYRGMIKGQQSDSKIPVKTEG